MATDQLRDLFLSTRYEHDQMNTPEFVGLVRALLDQNADLNITIAHAERMFTPLESIVDAYYCLKIDRQPSDHVEELLFDMLSRGAVPDERCLRVCTEENDGRMLEQLLKHTDARGKVYTCDPDLIAVARGFEAEIVMRYWYRYYRDVPARMHEAWWDVNPLEFHLLSYATGLYSTMFTRDQRREMIRQVKAYSDPPNVYKMRAILTERAGRNLFDHPPAQAEALFCEMYEFYQNL